MKTTPRPPPPKNIVNVNYDATYKKLLKMALGWVERWRFNKVIIVSWST